MKNRLKYALLLVMAMACQPDKPRSFPAQHPGLAVDSPQFITDTTLLVEEEQRQQQRTAASQRADEAATSDTTVAIRFRGLTVTISPVHSDETIPRLTTNRRTNEVTFDGTGYTAGGLRVTIQSAGLTDILVEERVGVMLMASQEEATYEFAETQRYAPWRKLSRVSETAFTGSAYTTAEQVRWLGLSLPQIKKIIRDGSDSVCYAQIRTVQNLNELELDGNIVVNSYSLRVSGRRKGATKRSMYRVTFVNQYGC